MSDAIPRSVSEKGDKNSNSSRRMSVSTSTTSRRSQSPVAMTKKTGPPTPESPQSRVVRKRAASRDRRETEIEDTSPSHTRVSSGDSATSHVCLCQPDPKIPRPRNAFILYRQHHQANVVAQHPGLANPEISKIIGEQWRAQPAAVKNEWKLLAEEEKLRHQQQYPEYRYQPRRNGRRGSNSEPSSTTTSTSIEKYRCNKCGGRSIITPNSGPFPNLHTAPLLPPPTPSSSTTPSTRFLPMMNNLSLSSPATSRNRPGLSNLSSILVARSYERPDEPSLSPLSPDIKRRRFNHTGGLYMPVVSRPGSGTPYPFPMPSQGRRESLPRPDQLLYHSPPVAGTMGPPARPDMSQSPYNNGRHSDASLTLPPLQTSTGGTGDQSRSVEAMVMSMPYIGKLKILRSIAPPLKAPGPSSPVSAVRGAVVAVEGEDVHAVGKLTEWLANFLQKSGEFTSKVTEGPKVPRTDEDASLRQYLDAVGEWHVKSKEMVEFITTTPRAGDADEEDAGEDCGGTLSAIPVLLLPSYQLHTSDAYACRIPITDAYSPADHWQWMATMWRGVVGPDITVYIRDTAPGEMGKDRAVEVKEDVKCLVIRKEKDAADVEEKALRRVGFEVGEWVRSISNEAREGREG